MKVIIEILIFAIIGTVVGYLYRDINEKIKGLHKKIDEPKEVGTTPGVYGKVNDYGSNQDGEIGLVIPKTPEQVAWEEDERLRQANLEVKVK